MFRLTAKAGKLLKLKAETKRIGGLLAEIAREPGRVKVGLIGGKNEEREDEGLTNAELGLIHEFGTSTIPARPFIGPAYKKHAEEYKAALAKLVQGAVKAGKISYDQALGMLGAKAAADFKNFVTRGDPIPPPNAPATLARKQSLTRKGSTGSVRTLIDTGRMVAAITWQVTKKGDVK